MAWLLCEVQNPTVNPRPERAATRAQVDRKLADAAACGFDARLSGTTACLALVAGDQVATANVGDSRAIVVRAAPGDRLQAIQLTQDAKPELPGVRARAALSRARRAAAAPFCGVRLQVYAQAASCAPGGKRAKPARRRTASQAVWVLTEVVFVTKRLVA
jgi:hypothetical protein